METIKNISVGDYVEISNTDAIVKSFIRYVYKINGDTDRLRALCSIKENKKYKVVDVCKACKIIKIKVGKYHAVVKYNNIIFS